MNLVRATASIGGLTLVSRLLALVRDTLMARYVGAGFASDAFQIAWRLPNLFRALFAEGAFAAVFVPMYNHKLADSEDISQGRSLAVAFAGQVLSVFVPLLVVFTAVLIVGAMPIVWIMSGGFQQSGGADKVALAVYLSRITFPYLALISVVSLLGGILNSLDRFWVNAAAPILLNICMVAGLLFFRGATPEATAATQAIAVTVSGALQLAWLIFSCRRAGVVLRLGVPRLSPDVRRLLLLIGPAALGQGAIQLNLVVSSALAGHFLPQGAISYLYYADRINQLPLGLIGIGIGTAMLPSLSRRIKSGDEAAAGHMQNRAIELALLLAIPAAIALVVSATPIIRGILQHGAFGPRDTVGAARALAAFSLGVPAYVLIKVLTPGFYARQDTRTPVRIALIAMLVNLIGNLVLIWPLQHAGVALATAISAWVNAGLLYATLHRRGLLTIDRRLRQRALRLVASGAIMGAGLAMLGPVLDPYMSAALLPRIAALALLCASGAALYAAAALGMGAFSLRDLRQQLSRKA